MKTNYFWLVLFLITQNYLFSQPANIDSVDAGKIDSLFSLSNKNWNPKGPYDQNLKWLEEAERISIRSMNWKKQVESLLIQSTVYGYKRDTYHFNKVVNKSYQVASKYLDEEDPLFKYIYNYMSNLYRKKRAYGKSNEVLEKSIKLCSDCSAYLLSKIYIKIANNYNSLGDYNKAQQYLENTLSLNFTESDNDYFQLYHTHYVYALLYKKKQKLDESIEHIRQAESYLTISFKDHYMNELVNLWFEFIELNLKLENPEEANRYLEKVKNSDLLSSDLTQGRYKLFVAKSNYMIENQVTEEFVGLIDEGVKLLDRAETVTVSLDLMIAEQLEYKGDIYLRHLENDEALASYDEAIAWLGYENKIHNAAEMGNKDIVIRLLGKKLKIHLLNSNFEEAQRIEDATLNLMRYLRIENSSASTLDYWANENLKIIEQIIEHNFQASNYAKVYAAIEENKSNNLVQDILENESLGYANIDKEIIEEGRALNSDIAYCRNRIFEIKQLDSIDLSELKTWTQEESRLQIAMDSYLRNLEQDFPEYHRLKYNLKEVDVKNVQAGLDKHSVLIEYFIGIEKGYAAFVTKDNIEVIEIENIASLKENALEYYQGLRNSNSEFESISKQLFVNLGLEKLKEFDHDIKDIIIVADDFLNNIPFETLSDGEESFLLNSYNIHYQYSAKLWEIIKSRKSTNKSYDLVGYAFDNGSKIYADNRSCFDLNNAANLNCAGKEVEAVIEILDAKKVLDVTQNISQLLSLADDTKILHLATHACLNQEDPDYSRILFNDTILTNHDLKQQEFGADLVVLSACESGFGKVIKGEGSMSLAKGFFHAGANSTLVSLWPVDDCSTSDLMSEFYRNLNDGMKKNEALRFAKLKYLETAHPSRMHPYYWAGFVLVGNEQAIWNEWLSIFSKYFLLIPVLILLIFIISFLFKKKIS